MYVGGPIADYFTVRIPQRPGLGYLLIFAIYALLFLLSAIVLVRVQETWEIKPRSSNLNDSL